MGTLVNLNSDDQDGRREYQTGVRPTLSYSGETRAHQLILTATGPSSFLWSPPVGVLRDR